MVHPFHQFFVPILVKCALDHPHHVLPKVLALVNAFKDEETLEKSSSPRTDAATKLLQKMKEKAILRPIIVQMEKMYEGELQMNTILIRQLYVIKKIFVVSIKF